MQYVAWLRGINVGGRNKILMADLKKLFQKMGLGELKTYLQSGNVLFATNEEDEMSLANEIEEGLFRQYRFNIPTIVVSGETLREVVLENPFQEEPLESLYVTFLKQLPRLENLKWLESFENENNPLDKLAIKGKKVFICCSGGYKKTKFSQQFLERKLQVAATTRNWRTITNVVGLMGDKIKIARR